MTTPLRSSRIPSGNQIDDFDLCADADGRTWAVCADSVSTVYSWDPAADHWRHHPLDMPFDDGEMDFTEIDAIAAVLVDGRIVVGGGAQHQPFALWDLESGAVRSHARLDHAGVGQARGGTLGGRAVLVAGDSSVPPRLRVWDATGDDTTEPSEHHGGFESTSDIALAELGGVPVVVWGQYDGTVSVWNADGECLRNFAEPDIQVCGVAVATVDGAERVVVAGNDVVLLGDPATGVWSSPAEEDEEGDFDETGISCVDTGMAAGRPIAVTGTADGVVQVWDLTTLERVGEPLRGHEDDVNAVRVTVLDGRTVAITAGRDGFLHVWDVEAIAG